MSEESSLPASWMLTQEEEPLYLNQMMRGSLNEVWASLASGGSISAEFVWDGISLPFHVRNVAGVGGGDLVISGMVECADRQRFTEGSFRIEGVDNDEVVGEVRMEVGIGNKVAIHQLAGLRASAAMPVVMFVDEFGDNAGDESTYLLIGSSHYELVRVQPDGKLEMTGMRHNFPQPNSVLEIKGWVWPNDITS